MRPVKTPPLPSFAGTAAPQLSSPAPVTPLIPPPVKVAPPVKIPAQDPQASLQNAFVRPRKEVVGTNMRQDLYDWVQSYPGGVSAFFEDAIKEFKGTLEELVAAGVRFEDTRRVGQGVVGPVNGRVPPALKQRTVDMLQAAKNARVKRASHSKIIAGYVQLAIERMQVQNEGAPASMEE